MRHPQGAGWPAERHAFRERLRMEAAEWFAQGNENTLIARFLRVSGQPVRRASRRMRSGRAGVCSRAVCTTLRMMPRANPAAIRPTTTKAIVHSGVTGARPPSGISATGRHDMRHPSMPGSSAHVTSGMPVSGGRTHVCCLKAELRGRFIPLFHPGIWCLVWVVGSRQEMVFSPVRRRVMRSVMAMLITASERVGRVS